MKKPLIGVTPLIDIGKDSYWMLPGYMKGIEEAGGIPVVLPLTSDTSILTRLAETMDGFLFTGGQDVSPSLYDCPRSAKCGECSPERDAVESALFPMIFDLDKPILGICRGIQLINVLLGGSLYQDLPEEYPSSTEHHQHPPYDIPIHTVSILPDTPLYEALSSNYQIADISSPASGLQRLPVNSYHHQAVKQLAPALLPMAYSEDGLIEAVWAPGKNFVWAVQWHPEFSFKTDINSMKIFQQFILHTY